MSRDDWLVASGVAETHGHGYEWRITDADAMRVAIEKYADDVTADE